MKHDFNAGKGESGQGWRREQGRLTVEKTQEFTRGFVRENQNGMEQEYRDKKDHAVTEVPNMISNRRTVNNPDEKSADAPKADAQQMIREITGDLGLSFGPGKKGKGQESDADKQTG